MPYSHLSSTPPGSKHLINLLIGTVRRRNLRYPFIYPFITSYFSLHECGHLCAVYNHIRSTLSSQHFDLSTKSHFDTILNILPFFLDISTFFFKCIMKKKKKSFSVILDFPVENSTCAVECWAYCECLYANINLGMLDIIRHINFSTSEFSYHFFTWCQNTAKANSSLHKTINEGWLLLFISIF